MDRSRPSFYVVACTTAALLVLLLALAGCKKSPPPNVSATVNGRSITNDELEKYYQTQFASTEEASADDEQALIQKLEVLRTLIDSEIMLQRAEKQGLMATETDVDARLNELRTPYTQEEFQKTLEARKMTLDDLKAQIRRELSVRKLFNKEISSHIHITDKEVADFFEVNKASFNLAEPQIHLAQILVTPQPDSNVRNLKNDKSATDEQARRKIQMLEARLRQGEDFGMLAQNFSEDPTSGPNGGDLGFIAESAFERANIELRRAVLGLKPGQVSGIIRTPEGYRILKVIAREPAGQRDLNDPRVQQNIREMLLNRKDQLLRAAYYEVARNEADVTNYLALQITESRGVRAQ
jgi:peptidyl-prolyl cis-trans isomerase SurA